MVTRNTNSAYVGSGPCSPYGKDLYVDQASGSAEVAIRTLAAQRIRWYIERRTGADTELTTVVIPRTSSNVAFNSAVTDAAYNRALSEAKAIISDNFAGRTGGGFACNGVCTFGENNVDVTFVFTKKWEPNTTNIPATLMLKLHQRVGGASNSTIIEEVTINTSGTTTHTWTDLDENDSTGTAYVYTAKEVSAPSGYNETAESGTTVTNTFINLLLSTSAKDKKSGTNKVVVNSSVTIVYTVTYTNLIVGKTYIIRGTLMDKSTQSHWKLMVFR